MIAAESRAPGLLVCPKVRECIRRAERTRDFTPACRLFMHAGCRHRPGLLRPMERQLASKRRWRVHLNRFNILAAAPADRFAAAQDCRQAGEARSLAQGGHSSVAGCSAAQRTRGPGRPWSTCTVGRQCCRLAARHTGCHCKCLHRLRCRPAGPSQRRRQRLGYCPRSGHQPLRPARRQWRPTLRLNCLPTGCSHQFAARQMRGTMHRWPGIAQRACREPA